LGLLNAHIVGIGVIAPITTKSIDVILVFPLEKQSFISAISSFEVIVKFWRALLTRMETLRGLLLLNPVY